MRARNSHTFTSCPLPPAFCYISGYLLFSFEFSTEELRGSDLFIQLMYGASQTTEINTELFHIQTNKPLALPPNLPIISIGKPNDQKPPDIDVSNLPDSDVISRIHAQMWVNGNEYHICDMGSSNGTYVNNVKLQPKVFCQLQFGDTISFGQEDKVTFMFRIQPSATSNTQNFTPNSAPTKISSPTTNTEIAIVSKFMGLALILGGITFLTTSIYVSFYFRSTPGIILCIAGVVSLNWLGRENRILGWVLIGIGIALFIVSGAIIGSVSLFSLLLSFAAISCGFQLFTTGKVFNFNPLTLQQVIKK